VYSIFKILNLILSEVDPNQIWTKYANKQFNTQLFEPTIQMSVNWNPKCRF